MIVQLFGHLRFQLDQTAEEILHGAHQRLHLQPILEHFRHDLDAGAQERLLLRVFEQAYTLQPLHQQAHGAVGRLEHAMHLRRRADGVHLAGGGFVDIFVLAGDQGDDAVVGQRLFDQSDAALLADRQRQPHHRVDHYTAQGQHGQVVGNNRLRQALYGRILLAEFV